MRVAALSGGTESEPPTHHEPHHTTVQLTHTITSPALHCRSAQAWSRAHTLAEAAPNGDVLTQCRCFQPYVAKVLSAAGLGGVELVNQPPLPRLN